MRRVYSVRNPNGLSAGSKAVVVGGVEKIGAPAGGVIVGKAIVLKPIGVNPNVLDEKVNPIPELGGGAKTPNPAVEVKPEMPRRSTAMSFTSKPAPIRPTGLARPVA